jgi:perosamine synthetase
MKTTTRSITLSCPDISDADVEAVAGVLRSGRLSLGPKLPEFEQAVAQFVGVKHAVAVSSGTAALHLCLLASGIRAGDEVITTPFSFVASANCILYPGASPIFVDIDERTLNMDTSAIERVINDRTRAILPVHVFGRPCDMKTILELASARDVSVIEDACEALGARYHGRAVGSFGRAGTFAFYPNKQITTGEGGMIVTDDANLAAMCRSLRNQGREDGAAWLEHVRLGYNFRMSDIEAALGLSQLSRLGRFLEQRERVAGWYGESLRDCEDVILPPAPDPDTSMSWFVYVVLLRQEYTADDRSRTIVFLRERGIECSTYFPAIHLQPYFRERFGYRPGDFPVAESVASRSIALPFHSRMSRDEVERASAALKEAVASLGHRALRSKAARG